MTNYSPTYSGLLLNDLSRGKQVVSSAFNALVPLAFTIALILGPSRSAQAQPTSESAPGESYRVDCLEHDVTSLEAANRRLAAEVSALREAISANHGATNVAAAAEPEGTQEAPTQEANSSADSEHYSYEFGDSGAGPPIACTSTPSDMFGSDDFRVTYDSGILFASKKPEENPFTLKINSQNMLRYSGFARSESSWTNSAGTSIPIDNNSNFQIPRGRLIFSGRAFSPRFSYLLNIDYNTVSNNPIGFRAYSLSYEFSRALEVSIGQSKVPGTREWLESGFAPLEGPDRSMATTFFRPSLSQGIWIKGQPLDGVYYHGMMSNGYNTLNVNPRQFSNRFCWSGSAWWEPWGDFGGGYADWENHPEPVIRLGTSATLAIDQGIQSNDGGVENSLVRLSDGTNITQTGAFAAGATLQTYDVSLLAIDAAYKWRGASLSTEWYAQEISSLIADAALPINSTHAQGGFVQGGYFVRPQSVEIYSRASFVTGRYGSGTEQAAGLNWFVFPGQSNLRCTFDAAWLESSPASQNRTGYVAGQTGLLVRTQVSASY